MPRPEKRGAGVAAGIPLSLLVVIARRGMRSPEASSAFTGEREHFAMARSGYASIP